MVCSQGPLLGPRWGCLFFINSGLFVLFWTRSRGLQLFITGNCSLILLRLLCASHEHSQFDTGTLCLEGTPPMFLWLPGVHCVSGLATGSQHPVGGDGGAGSLVEPGSTSATELCHLVLAEAMPPAPRPTPF